MTRKRKQYHTIAVIVEGDGEDVHDIKQWLDDRIENINVTPEFPPTTTGQIAKLPTKKEKIIGFIAPILAASMIGLPIAKVAGLNISWGLASAPIWGTIMYCILIMLLWYVINLTDILIARFFGE